MKDRIDKEDRERKGAFYTPKIWVEKSQEYLEVALGKNWQNEYYIWDCASGIGNLLSGLTNSENVWASTLDQQDVDYIHRKIDDCKIKPLDSNNSNLLKEHIFQFDFLNDDFEKLPNSLLDIINTPEKRKKLIIYINPPYAEAGSYGEKSKKGISINTEIYNRYNKKAGKAINELFIQFLLRIKLEMNNCIIAEFSTLKHLQGSNFRNFREIFKVNFLKGFLVPANTFENVKGRFPIGFFIFDTNSENQIRDLQVEVFNSKGKFIQIKNVFTEKKRKQKINDWLKLYYDKKETRIGIMHNNKTDFQTSAQVCITSDDNNDHTTPITPKNLIPMTVYFAVRHCKTANWLNNRDQFFFPNEGWKYDKEFQFDCLIFTIFHFQNRIKSKVGVNHWIPFTEKEVYAKGKFESNFMSEFLLSFNSPSLGSTKSESVLNSPSLRGIKGELFSCLQNDCSKLEFALKFTPEYLQSHKISTKYLIFSERFLPYNQKLKERSKELRKAGNLSEAILWKFLKSNQMLGYSFQRQKPILNYIVDFYCKELALVIEIDGITYCDEKAQIYDAERDRQLKVLDLKILRINDKEVKQDIQSVLRWIENEINSNFKTENNSPFVPLKEWELSQEAFEVFEAGRELWIYYLSKPNCNINASLYDIREHFQGRNNKGRMNIKSTDTKYMELKSDLKKKIQLLAKNIEIKVYEYEFLEK